MNALSHISHPIKGSHLIGDKLDVVKCRQTVRQMTVELKFSAIEQSMLVTAASEIARNTLTHGGGGRFSWELVDVGLRVGVRLTFEDDGPGIPDIELAMTNGWTSAKSLGLGLPGTKRLVNEFDIESTVGRGTRVVITRWRK